MITDEVRYNLRGQELRIAQRVWSRRLYWSHVSGVFIKKRYGVATGYEATAVELRLKHAAQEHECDGCKAHIYVEEMHGSLYYHHFCLDCVEVEEPNRQFKCLNCGDGEGRCRAPDVCGHRGFPDRKIVNIPTTLR